MSTDSSSSPPRLRFGDCEVDLQSHELLRAGQKVRLQEKSFLVLNELLKSPGRVVTREELTAALWPKEQFVDAEHGLNTAVRRLREALGDSADTARYVETVPRMGYRFIGAVEAEEPAAAPEPVAAPPPGTARRASRAPLYALAAVLALAGILGGVLAFRARGSRAPRSSEAVQELLERSRYLRNQKRFAEAKAFIEQALALDPRNADVLAGLSLVLIGDGKDQEGRDVARRALEIDPKAYEALRSLGVVARAEGDMAEAERQFRRSVEVAPGDQKSRNRLARHLLECGRFGEALEQITESKRQAPDDPDVQNIWLEYALRTGDYESAIRQGEIWIAIWEKQLDAARGQGVPPISPEIRQMLGLAYVGARRVEQALAQFRAVDPRDDLRTALALGYAGRTPEARAILQAHDRSAAAARTDLGLAGATAMAAIVTGDFERAFRELDRQVAGRWFPGWLNCALFDAIRRDPRWPAFQERLQREFFRGQARAPFPARQILLQAWPRPAPPAG